MPEGLCSVCASKVRGIVNDSTNLRRLTEYIASRAGIDLDTDGAIEWIDSLISRNQELSTEISFLRDFAE